MFVVSDFNVVFSAVLGVGHSSKIFELNYEFNRFDFIAPQFLAIELGKHTERMVTKSKLSFEEVSEALQFVMNQITLIQEEDYQDKIIEAREILTDHQKDVPYLALALKYDCKIFSGDKTLKSIIPEMVRNPKEMLGEFEHN